MPRIPSREEPYHSVAKCNRHWKTKREFVTKAANKASHVDGSHYMLVCVTPKGSIEVHASEHFHDDANQLKHDGVINWDVLRRRVLTIKERNEERWQEIQRQEKRFGIEGEADDEEGDDAEDGGGGDEDRSTGEASAPPTAASGRATPSMMGQQPSFPVIRRPPPTPFSSVTVTPDSLDQEYQSRFEHLGQTVCANILKAWIKVVEPKKQTKYPYKDKKGKEGRAPPWWPTGMRHIEPDHLHKDERPRLLSSIIQQASKPRAEGAEAIAANTPPDSRDLTISRLHFATAEIGSIIPPRQHYELRQIYLIAKEVRKAAEDRLRELRASGVDIKDESSSPPDWSEITIDLYERPPQPSSSPVSGSKRSFDIAPDYDPRQQEGKENSVPEYERSSKRGKRSEMDVPALTPLASHQNVYGVHPYMDHYNYGVMAAPSPTLNNSYYRPVDMAQYPYAASPGYSPAYSQPTPQSQQPQYATYPLGYSQGSYAASVDTPGSQTQQTPTTAYSGYGYEQPFVGDLAGLSAST